MELYVADAFTTVRFSGNQAGVALLASLRPLLLPGKVQRLQ